MKRKMIHMIAVLGMFALMTGCLGQAEQDPSSATGGTAAMPVSTSSGSGGSAGSTVASTTSTSMIACHLCHADAGNPAQLAKVVGDSAASKASATGWLSGPHANNEDDSAGTDKHPDNRGYPSGFIASCTGCHDQKGDGQLLDDFYAETSDSSLGRIARPIIGCTSCHGSGANHAGVGPMEFDRPDAARCGQCHTDALPDWHMNSHPEADHIYEDYTASPHASAPKSVDANGNENPRCSRCHSDEGGRKYRAIMGNATELTTYFNTQPLLSNPTSVQCRTCHEPHNPDVLLFAANSTQSAEWRTCTNCHQTYIGATYNLDLPYHRSGSTPRWNRTILDTHFDNALTPEIEGYILDPKNDRVCRDCHNVHSASLTINEQWANSGHGGNILNTTIRTGGIAAVNSSDGPAWDHYNFITATFTSSCRRCHTSTGFKNLADNPASPAANVFSATGDQREMLYCWACHKDSAGGLRTPGAFNTTISPYAAPADRIANVPDMGGSNLCMACHSGRESGGNSVTGGSIASSTGDFTNLSMIQSHYFPAGGIVYRTIGYEYGSASYDDYGWFTHSRIGDGTGATGKNGSCVGCHMRSTEGHTLEAVTRDNTGAITNIPVFTQSCASCHSDKAALIATLTTRKTGYDAAITALTTLMATKGYIYNSSHHPYFFTATYNESYTETGVCTSNLPIMNWQTGGTSTYMGVFSRGSWSCTAATNVVGTPGTGKNNMGAAFNLLLLDHEPGAYTHNSLYAKRLLYDTIDYMDDYALNSSVGATLGAGAARTFLNEGVRP